MKNQAFVSPQGDQHQGRWGQLGTGLVSPPHREFRGLTWHCPPLSATPPSRGQQGVNPGEA